MSSIAIRRLIGLVAGLALTLGIGLSATPASAASTVWDKVASCESGGRWNINTGNGYYGGLQFSSSTWKGYGGKAYAGNAHQATKAEQIAVARRVLARQGAGAWPSCGRKAKLTKSNGKADKKATTSTNPGSSKVKATAKKKPATTKKPTAKPVSTSTSTKTVRVKSGDTLAKIAKRNHVSGGWRGLWKLNKKTVKNANRISVGQVLKIA